MVDVRSVPFPDAYADRAGESVGSLSAAYKPGSKKTGTVRPVTDISDEQEILHLGNSVERPAVFRGKMAVYGEQEMIDGGGKVHCQIEKMANIGALSRRTHIPLVAFPTWIEDASAGWVRPVAFIEEGAQ